MSNKYLYYAVITVIGLAFLLSADYFMYDYTQNVGLARFISETDIDSTAMGEREYLPANVSENFYESKESIPGKNIEILTDIHELGEHTIK